jgi:SAM-dependent methyltransferase
VLSYDRLGRQYSATRHPDPTIRDAINAAIGDARTVVNIGAGTGSYEPADRAVVGVEPSEVMIRQRPDGAAPVVRSVAEALPFADEAFDASLAVFTIHHWTDRDRGLAEMRRVARRRAVVLVSDIEVERSFWFNERYFPSFVRLDRERLPPPAEILERLGGGSIVTVPVRHDCVDGFCSAFWRRPEAYLDPRIRSGISYFSCIDPGELEAGLRRLERDLRTGAWADRFGDLLGLDQLDTGQRLVIADVGKSA